MEQVFEGVPKATIQIQGRKVTRSEVENDWGSQLRWQLSQNGTVVSTASARAGATYEFPGTAAGKYDVVLQLFKYVNYRKDAKGQFTTSKFVDISNTVSFTI